MIQQYAPMLCQHIPSLKSVETKMSQEPAEAVRVCSELVSSCECGGNAALPAERLMPWHAAEACQLQRLIHVLGQSTIQQGNHVKGS
jgi:hypothetical protein